MKETTLAKKVLDYLNSLPECKAIKIHGNMYTQTGTPDIVGCIKGRMFLFELKVPGNKPTEIQERRLREWRAAGALAEVIYSMGELKAKISLYIEIF